MISRYTFVRYEDLVEDTERRLESLFHFMEIPFTDYIREVAFNQTHTEERKGYFSSFRGSGFVHDSWRKKLSKEVSEIGVSVRRLIFLLASILPK